MKTVLKNILRFLKKLPRMIAEHAFPACIAFILLAVILSALIFYKYCILVEKVEPELSKIPAQFDEQLCQQVLKQTEEQQKRFQETDYKQYPDLF